MTREIKFRAWDKVNKIYYPDVQNTYDEMIGDNFQNVLDNEDLVIEQYTGLKDKNGVEIYEGDFIKAKGSLYKVEWFNTSFWAIPEVGYGSSQPISNLYEYGECKIYKLEVIGNIHENPELLGDK